MSDTIDGFFVYGTLKLGQCRSHLWPSQPIEIIDAWTRGALYGRHDYPALVSGDDRVAGELWRFPIDDLAQVIEVVDRIEGTNQPEHADLYRRTEATVWSLEENKPYRAYVYHYATDPVCGGFAYLPPQPDQFSRWP